MPHVVNYVRRLDTQRACVCVEWASQHDLLWLAFFHPYCAKKNRFAFSHSSAPRWSRSTQYLGLRVGKRASSRCDLQYHLKAAAAVVPCCNMIRNRIFNIKMRFYVSPKVPFFKSFLQVFCCGWSWTITMGTEDEAHVIETTMAFKAYMHTLRPLRDWPRSPFI